MRWIDRLQLAGLALRADALIGIAGATNDRSRQLLGVISAEFKSRESWRTLNQRRRQIVSAESTPAWSTLQQTSELGQDLGTFL